MIHIKQLLLKHRNPCLHYYTSTPRNWVWSWLGLLLWGCQGDLQDSMCLLNPEPLPLSVQIGWLVVKASQLPYDEIKIQQQIVYPHVYGCVWLFPAPSLMRVHPLCGRNYFLFHECRIVQEWGVITQGFYLWCGKEVVSHFTAPLGGSELVPVNQSLVGSGQNIMLHVRRGLE